MFRIVSIIWLLIKIPANVWCDLSLLIFYKSLSIKFIVLYLLLLLNLLFSV